MQNCEEEDSAFVAAVVGVSGRCGNFSVVVVVAVAGRRSDGGGCLKLVAAVLGDCMG